MGCCFGLWLLYVAFRCLGPAGYINCLFSFPYPCFPPTAQCFDSQLYRVCKGGGPVWLLPEGRMETRQLHVSCSGKHTSPPSCLGLITLITCVPWWAVSSNTDNATPFNWRLIFWNALCDYVSCNANDKWFSKSLHFCQISNLLICCCVVC